MADLTKDYWNGRYSSGGNSGYGSYDEQLTKKLNWLKDLNVKTITEIGCGDFNFGKELLYYYPESTYIGQDISDVIIKKNKELYSNPHRTFTTEMQLPGADLTLCIDVLYHVLDDNEYEVLLLNLKQDLRFGKYLAITAYENEQPTAPHLKIRKFDPSYFGKPIIREVVEEDGQLYFYLFKNTDIDLTKTSACLITKDPSYPGEVLSQINALPFGEILVMTNCDSPHRKYELFEKAKFETLYYQDDDAIVPIQELLKESEKGKLNIGMKPGHLESYKNHKMTMGLGWGAFFQKYLLKTLKKYTDIYGEDEVYKRETERILTALNFKLQNRVSLNIVDLPSATAPDRLWREAGHHENAILAEERCINL